LAFQKGYNNNNNNNNNKAREKKRNVGIPLVLPIMKDLSYKHRMLIQQFIRREKKKK